MTMVTLRMAWQTQGKALPRSITTLRSRENIKPTWKESLPEGRLVFSRTVEVQKNKERAKRATGADKRETERL